MGKYGPGDQYKSNPKIQRPLEISLKPGKSFCLFYLILVTTYYLLISNAGTEVISMDYWFTDPMIKSLLPLMSASAIGGLAGSFSTPKLVFGPNVFPEGPGLGANVVDQMATHCEKKRAFIYTDEFAERFAKKVEAALVRGGFTTETWAHALPEAPVENVHEGAESMKAFAPDLIIAVGGGSVMDGAKAAWVLYERDDITDLYALSPMAPLNIRKKAILAAVPTTSGTGSECTGTSVLHDDEHHRKVPINSPELKPDYAILVPEFTASMPPNLTAGTGLDALSHAMDCIPTSAGNELTESMALAAIQMIMKYLPRAYNRPNDTEARYRMAIAASTAGIAFGESGAALTHAFGHTLGSIYDIHHGIAVGIFIPYAYQFYAPVSDKYLTVCKALDIEGATDKEKLDGLVAKMKSFFTELGIPTNLKDLGIDKAEFEANMEKMVLYTVEDITSFFSPRPMTAKQCERIWQYAYEGKDIDF
jgi:alcohol dehydrogenase class IV